MSFEKLAEKRISQAMSEGQFDNLSGKGERINLDWYFSLPEDLRLTYSILRNADILPDEVALLREIGELQQQLDACSDEEEKAQLNRSIQENRLRFDLMMEARKKRKS
jgi:DnaJ-like protein